VALKLDPPRQKVHPHVVAVWAKHGELKIALIGRQLAQVQSVSIVQTSKDRTMFIYFTFEDEPNTLKFENPTIEDMGDDTFQVYGDRNQNLKSSALTSHARLVRTRMPPAFLCTGCEVCRP